MEDKYSWLRTARYCSIPVEIKDIESGKVLEFKSLYNAGKSFDVSAQAIAKNNGKIWRGKYEVKLKN
jgi:hypothetical protein